MSWNYYVLWILFLFISEILASQRVTSFVFVFFFLHVTTSFTFLYLDGVSTSMTFLRSLLETLDVYWSKRWIFIHIGLSLPLCLLLNQSHFPRAPPCVPPSFLKRVCSALFPSALQAAEVGPLTLVILSSHTPVLCLYLLERLCLSDSVWQCFYYLFMFWF